jgi:hypothetical protein
VIPLAVAVSVPVGILAVLGLGLAVAYSLWIAASLLRGYRTATARRTGWLALGLLLLTTVPISVRFLAGTSSGLAPTGVSILALGSELLGLVAILGALYAPRRGSDD